MSGRIPYGSEGVATRAPPLRRVDLCVAGVLVGAAIVPLWVGRWLPFLDLPQHLGLAAIVSRLGDPAAGYQRWYALGPIVTPYWGYLAPMRLLAAALPIEIASKVLLSLYAAAVPLAAGWVLRGFGRDPRWAVFTLPLVYNTNVFFGFASFVVSIPVFLVALGLTDRYLSSDRPSGGATAAVAAAAAIVFLCHAQTYLLYGLCTLVLAAIHARRGRWIARGLAFLPSVVLFAAWAVPAFLVHGGPRPVAHTVHYQTYGSLRHLGARYEPLGEILSRIPERTVGSFNDGSDQVLAAAALVALLLAVALAHGDGSDRGRGGRAAIAARRGELLTIVVLASYLLLPMEVAGQWYLAPRYLVFAALLAPSFVRGPVTGRGLLLSGAAVIGILSLANVAEKIRAFQGQVGPYERIEAVLEPGGRVLGLPFDNGSLGPVRQWPFLHWAAYYQVHPGGDVGFSFAGLPSIPVTYLPGAQAPHPYEWRPDQFDWDSMGSHYDYFLVRGVPGGAGGRALEAHAVVIRRAGEWSLWTPRESTGKRSARAPRQAPGATPRGMGP